MIRFYSIASGVLGMFGAVFSCFEMWPRAIALILLAILVQMWANELAAHRAAAPK